MNKLAMRLVAVALFSCLSTGHAQRVDSFTGDFDVTAALTIVYGRAPWNDADATPFNTFENGQDFIEPLFDAAYTEDGFEKHIVIATLTPRPRSQHSCHACSPMLGGVVFRRDGDRWRIESVGERIEYGHAWFDAKHGRLELVEIGADRFGLLHSNDDVNGGYEQKKRGLIFGIGDQLSNHFTAPSISGPGPGACGIPVEQRLGLSLDNRAVAGTEYFDVIVDAQWNDADCRSLRSEDGRIVGATWSGQTCRRTTRYRFSDGAYRLLATLLDECTDLPEGSTSFRD